MSELISSLEFREGTSDKVYYASVDKVIGGYVVNFSYGRRGNSLLSGTKTNTPVSYGEAEHIYHKLVHSKTAKGYKHMSGSSSYNHSPAKGVGTTVVAKEKDDTGMRHQLLNPISEGEAQQYIDDPKWVMQEKFDGKRMSIRKINKVVVAANKKGLKIGFPVEVENELKAMKPDFEIDGEAIGDTLYLFDLLSFGETGYKNSAYSERLQALNLNFFGKHIKVVTTAFTKADKIKMMADLRKAGKEGAVFKNKNSTWSAGRPSSGGNALKCKFWESCSAIVHKINGKKRSIEVALETPIGNVTIPPNVSIPNVGDVVEIKYLYVAGEGGSLYQPIYLGVRDDVSPDECTFKQQKLKYKGVAVKEDSDDNDEFDSLLAEKEAAFAAEDLVAQEALHNQIVDKMMEE